MSINVREAKPGDEPFIVQLIEELAQADGESSPITERYVQEYLAYPGSHILLAEADGRILGLLSYSVRPDLYHAADSGLVETLIVRGSERGHGVGSALMSGLIGHLASVGCAEVSVSTMPDNEEARRFYRSHGLVDEAVFLEKHF